MRRYTFNLVICIHNVTLLILFRKGVYYIFCVGFIPIYNHVHCNKPFRIYVYVTYRIRSMYKQKQ